MTDRRPIPAERDLVLRVRSGDQEALRTLHDRYQPELWRFALGNLRDPAAAADVVQDAFIAVWNHRGTLDPEQSVRAYLYRTVRNGILMLHRADNVAARVESELLQDPSAVLGDASGAPESLTEAADLRAAVGRALASLTERQRTAVVLRWLRQMSYDEVAMAMGISRQAVHALLQRTHATLEQALRPFRAN